MMDKQEIDRYLAELDRNPAEVMDRIPPKRTLSGGPAGGLATALDAATIASGDFVLLRDRVRSRLYGEDADGNVVRVADLVPGKAPIEEHDRAEDLVDDLRYSRPTDMDRANLSEGALAETPWSGDYWPVYLGILGFRYADPRFPASTNWKENHDYVAAHPAAKVVAAGGQAAIDALSPAEKYDLLVGDAQGTLTAAMWADGQRAYDRTGSVETWMGICEGWAPASYMVARPRRTVTVKSAEGIGVRFFPSDIKALASLLWARSAPAVRFIGARCDDKNPKKDENGHVLDGGCFDTNPGTWHLAVVNQIGVAKRALVMDSTYDYQVWNQPVCAYAYHYFNPQKMSSAASVAEGTVARGDFTRDRFAKYRTSSYASVLGVAMRTHYVGELRATPDPTDDPSRDRIVIVDYYYDLELDGAGNILGGEWYVNRHADFLWSPVPGGRAVTPADAFATETWDGSAAMPASWRSAAVRASTDGMPLAKIVERLVALASG